MLNKSLIQFSVDRWSFVPSLLFTWVQIIVEVMKVMVTSLKRSHSHTSALGAPNPAAGHHWPTPLLETPGHSWASLGQSLVGSLLLSSASWCTQGSVCALQESFPQSCVSSGSSVVELMVTIPRGFMPYPSLLHPEPLHLRQSTADPYLHRRHSSTVLSQFLLGLWVLVLEPSERLWWVWGLILNMILPLLPSCWGFSFALGCGVSPHSRSSAVQAPLQHLPSCWVFSVLGRGVSPHSHPSATVSWNLTIIAY